MFNPTTAWLCQYDNSQYIDIYGIEATLPEIIDATVFYKLKQKKVNHKINKLEQEQYGKHLDSILDFKKTWFSGQYIEEKNMPTKAYKKPSSELPKSQEVAFQITEGYLVVNKSCYEVMSQFRLGDTHFSEIEILDMHSRSKIIDTPYYFINIAETRAFLDLEHSTGLDGNPYAPSDERRYIDNPKDNDIKLENSAKDCDVDIWHDPLLVRSLFLSDALVQALFEAGITSDDLALVRCNIQ